MSGSKTHFRYEDMTLKKSMTVLSIDVGIQNLAMCVLSYKEEKWDILHWSNEAFISKFKPIKCQALLKNGNQCANIGSIKDNNNTFCGRHKSQIQGTSKVITRPKNVVKNLSEYTIVKDLLCYLKDIQTKSWVSILTHVIIERQPVRSRKMMLVADVLFAAWVPLCSKVVFVPPMNKIKTSSNYAGGKVARGARGYKARKTESINVAENVIDMLHLNQNLKDVNGKQDDYADTLMQALYFMKNSK